jgi:TrwC relaxase/AAA domain
VTAVVTAKGGFDAAYPWRSAGKGDKQAGSDYYLQAGEPPGRWAGRGAEALGLAGQISEAERGAYEAVYAQTDPRTGERLGRRPPDYSASYKATLDKLLAAEPHATAERRVQLEWAAHEKTRQARPYQDVTVSWSKSLSVFHASLRANAALARQAGDEELAGWWDRQEQDYAEILQDANKAMLEYAERHAGFTRTGYHGAKVNGTETGKWASAGPVISSWLQGTSRDGDPQDHTHNLWARVVRTDADGRWRALDTVALSAQLPAMQAVAVAHAEAALTRRFGVDWITRKNGSGREIKGITQAQMDEFSSRRETIKEEAAPLLAQFERDYGRKPNQRETCRIMQQVTLATREGKEETHIPWDEHALRWNAQLHGELAQIARRVARGPQAQEAAQGPAQAQLAIAAQTALARVQAQQATWTRADLMKQIGLAMPAGSRSLSPAEAVVLVQELTDRAISGEFEPVAELTRPEFPATPDYLRRELDGRSVYTRPGSARYATHVQLSLEERLLQAAQRETSAHLTREDAARLLGADADALDAQLRERAAQARAGGHLTPTGLRLDQAAALHYALTSPRTAEALVGPAGSGKTRALAEAARIWQAMGLPVIGLATSQAARNVLAAAGVPLAENIAQFLGHLPGQRGALGVRELQPGTLILFDEASMTPTPDMADLYAAAAAGEHKVITCGDQEQLTAVEGGGGMALHARTLGFVQLAEAVRFEHEWEQEASLGLRAGQQSALLEYDARGRITGDEPEQAMDAARAAYVSRYLSGTDVLLIAADHERCAELSRRVRDDLVHLGVVDDSREAELSRGAKAGAGDVIIARQNDHRLEAGEKERTLANGDVMRVESVTEDGTLMVRRRTDRDPVTGARGWSAGVFPFRDFAHADLGYATTAHSAQGLTVSGGLAVVTGQESRQWLYSAMTRGAQENHAIVMTMPRLADPDAGTRPAPELARHERISAERAGQPVSQPHPSTRPDPREPLAVLMDVLERDDAEVSATEYQHRELASADHLAVLNARWQGETTGLLQQRYRELAASLLPDGHDAAELDKPQATWLWRTLRGAEAAGLDAREVLRRAIECRSLAGVRDLASVLDSRIRRENGAMIPAAARTWTEQVPQCGGERQRYLEQIAQAMDERKERLGEFAAETSPAWATAALGEVPADPVDRLQWQQRASQIGAYRELYGWDHETEPCGPEPAGDSPEKRAAWHAAYGAMTRTDEAAMSALPDGTLHHMMATYESETAWLPQYVGGELRQVRQARNDMTMAAIKADAEAALARREGDADRASRHEALGRSARAAGVFYAQREELDARLMEDRSEALRLTEGPRHLAVMAYSEVRRRHPDMKLEPLRSAEPEPAPDELPAVTDERTAAEHAAAVAARREAVRAAIEGRKGVMVPAEDPDYGYEGEAWPAYRRPDRNAVLQPPKPELRPSPRVLEHAAPQPEAG